MTLLYNPGVTVRSGASVQATSGSLTSVAYASNGLWLIAGNNGASVIAQQFATVSGSTITGQAGIPTGTKVTVANSVNSHTATITNGSFTIPLSTRLGRPAASSKPLTVRCRRSGSRCSANVSIAGGASNRPVTVRLPSPRMRLIAMSAHPRTSGGAYTISRSRYTGSDYRFVLNAVRANPRGAHFTLTFAN